jgi:hypothetical protein
MNEDDFVCRCIVLNNSNYFQHISSSAYGFRLKTSVRSDTNNLVLNVTIGHNDVRFIVVKYIPFIVSRGSSVSIVSGYGLDDRAIEVRYPVEAIGVFL